MLLSIENVTKKFGGLKAVDECSFIVEKKEILGLIGPNGSGKTTLFNTVTGIYTINSGEIHFGKRRIDGLKTHEIARLGIGRTFQIVRLYKNMTVLENMVVAGLHSPSVSNREKRKKSAIDLLNYVDLIDLKDNLAANLSYGQRKLLEFAAVLMFNPELILLDEPASGVNPVMIQKIVGYIKDLRSKGKTFIVIEHNMNMIMNLCERIVVLNSGRKIAEGPPEEITRNKAVIEAYLGE